MVSNPIVDGLVVVLGVLDVFVDLLRVVLISRPTRRSASRSQDNFLVCSLVPSAHVDNDGQAIGEDSLSRFDVDIVAGSRRRGVEARVVGRKFATVCCEIIG